MAEKIRQEVHVSREYILCSIIPEYDTFSSIIAVILMVRVFEPEHDKTIKMTRAPSEDSEQSEHPPSLISLRCPPKEGLGP